MGTTEKSQNTNLIRFKRLWRQVDKLLDQMLEQARSTEVKDRDAAARVVSETAEIGRAGQAIQGRLLMMLAQTQRLDAAPGGLDAWIGAHLDVTRGTAIGIARQAKTLGAVPQLATPLRRGSLIVGQAQHDQRSGGDATGEHPHHAPATKNHRRLHPHRNTDSPSGDRRREIPAEPHPNHPTNPHPTPKPSQRRARRRRL